MSQKTQNRQKVQKSSSSNKENLLVKISSIIRTILLAIMLFIIVLAQGIIIKQNELIGKEVQWISFLVEGGKKREPKPRPFSNPTSPRSLRHYKANSSFNNLHYKSCKPI